MKHCIAVVDTARARIFALDSTEARGAPSHALRELKTLAEPTSRLRSSEALSDSLPLGHTAPGGGPSHTYDDHRDARRHEMVRRFARDVVKDAIAACSSEQANLLTVASSEKMLGELRHEMERVKGLAFRVEYLNRKLCHMEPVAIQEQLTLHGLLPVD